MPDFKDIYGQKQIVEHLQNAISSEKISHAYIINGERSSGKEFIAKISFVFESHIAPLSYIHKVLKFSQPISFEIQVVEKLSFV